VALNLAPVAIGKRLSFILDVHPSAEGLRRGDAARLRQILSNLTSNAVKFTAGGEVKLMLVGLGEHGAEQLAVMVADTGPGIAPDKLPSLFDKFTQVDNSATRRFGGTGLGLAICRELATLDGGAYPRRESRREGLRLPGRAAVPPGWRMSRPSRSPLRPRRNVRTTGPSGSWRRRTPDQPARPPRRSGHLRRGPDRRRERVRAVQAWRSGHFDVILMDIQMPEMDGAAATRAIRSAEKAEGRPRTPILALSANAMTHQVSEYLAAGMDAHLAKPIEIPKLQAALEAALAGSLDAAASAA
jgi:CheY-like chemotaxis protein